MNVRTFTPHPAYMTKQRIAFGLAALAILLFGSLIALPIGLDPEIGPRGGLAVAGVLLAIAFVFWASAALLIVPYYHSLLYEIHPEEIIVRVGILTKSVKHVPYRTVTNIEINRGILDRLFGLGTLKVQTAGMSGQTGAEQNLVGLINVQELYDLVTAELHRFRAGMTPTAADLDPVRAGREEPELLAALLAEVRAIRTRLDDPQA